MRASNRLDGKATRWTKRQFAYADVSDARTKPPQERIGPSPLSQRETGQHRPLPNADHEGTAP